MTQPQQPLTPEQNQQEAMAYRQKLVSQVQHNAAQPDMSAETYQSLGINVPNVKLTGYRANISDLKPGDLIGWKGGHQPDGTYAGNVAVYAGNGEILESFFGRQRRRKLNPNEDVFGMPVNLPGDNGNAP